ncbi:WRKY transcription factor 68-like isoform X1 [Nicotiana sylvestris]|uniref:Probable WRKY transcription factor 68 isoform X1 n=1 Tax=Nicotiana sylvestris TaxID=4096 RepID=A0A1U7XQB2_NICSY|nr:PREDICTED: probable WRKY transcription factor 68 isoform X1 [Nicotiana sylvestris]
MESYRDIAIKMEDPMSYFDNFPVISNSFTGLVSDYNFAVEGKNNSINSSLGFMELLGVQDFSSASVFDATNLDKLLPKEEKYHIEPAVSTAADESQNKLTVAADHESSNIFNTPSTPNSSSISSETNEGHAQDAEGEVAEKEQTKTKQHRLKAKKTVSQKKKREPRIAFMTKSEVDFLEDGYRWRKYGQKTVKNSSFPRNYYRCTSASCNVKKRVERCFNDPSIVVTTYEGKHTHPSPMNMNMINMPRPTLFPTRVFPSPAPTATFPLQMPFPINQFAQPHFNDLTTSLASNLDHAALVAHGRRFCSTPSAAEIMRDQGFLQDLMSSRVVEEDYR